MCPTRLVRSLQLFKFQTFTSLSQPADTIRGVFRLGEKRTHDTHSLWPSSVIEYFNWPKVFLEEKKRSEQHFNRVSSQLQLSTETAPTPSPHMRPLTNQRLMLRSRDPETIWRLSAEKATDSTSLECPMKRRVVTCKREQITQNQQFTQ
jgi:hypothetical protein